MFPLFILTPSRFSLKKDYVFWIFFTFFFILYVSGLDNRPFATPDEGRYVEIPREMLLFNDWITPRLNGFKYFEKPPLLYWMLAFVQKTLGDSEFLMRLPISLFGFLTSISTYFFTKNFFSKRAAIISLIALSTSVLWFSLSRLILTDMPFSTFITLSLYSFFKGLHEEQTTRDRRLYIYDGAIFCALALLTKGFVSLVIVGGVFFFFLCLTFSWKKLFPLYFWSSLTIFLMISAPWHLFAHLQNPEFFHKYFIVEHFLRYTTTIHLRDKPFWFFFPIFLLGLIPWTGFFMKAFYDAIKSFIFTRQSQHPLLIFCVIWISFVLLFFSFSNSKLIPYILPIFPPSAILVGYWLDQALDDFEKLKSGLYISLALFLSLCLIGLLLPKCASLFNIADLYHNPEYQPLLPHIYFLIFLFLLLSFLLISILFKKITSVHIALFLIFSVGLLWGLNSAAPLIQKPSVKPFVEYLKAQKFSDETPLVSYGMYYQDLPFYAKKRVIVVNFVGELEFGAQLEKNQQFVVSHEQFNHLIQQSSDSEAYIILHENLIRVFKKNHPTLSFRKHLCQNNLCLLITHRDHHS